MALVKRIHFETHGEGTREIIICNGLSQSTANWRGIARSNPQYRWILFDARGCGKSPLGKRPYSLDDHVDDLFYVMEKAEVSRPVIMGFSHGGRVALRAVAQAPERFAGLVLVSVGSADHIMRRAHVASWKNALELGGVRAMAWASLPNIVGRKILERFTDWSMLVNGTANRNSEEGLRAMFEGMTSYPTQEEDARRISLPTLVMRGGEDPLLGAEDDEHFLSWIKGARAQLFEDCGHTLPLEESTRFIEGLGRFIDEINVA